MKKLFFYLLISLVGFICVAETKYITENPPASNRNYYLKLQMPSIVDGEKKQEQLNKVIAQVRRKLYTNETVFWSGLYEIIRRIEVLPNALGAPDGSVVAPGRVTTCVVTAHYDSKGKYLGYTIYMEIHNWVADLHAIFKEDYNEKNECINNYYFNKADTPGLTSPFTIFERWNHEQYLL